MKREIREYTVSGGRSQFGTSFIFIICPFCGEKVKAYLWSLAGTGKKCPECGAIHTYLTGTVKETGGKDD